MSIAYLASPDLSGTMGIIIYFLRRKYPGAGKAAKGLMMQYVIDAVIIRCVGVIVAYIIGSLPRSLATV